MVSPPVYMNDCMAVNECLRNECGSVEISGGPMESDYHLKQFHFHWGSESSHGSEHKIDGKVFAAEVRMVRAQSSCNSIITH